MSTSSLSSPLGPYRLERKLGGGGFADVWLAVDTRRGHQVALKVLHPQHANTTEVLRRITPGSAFISPIWYNARTEEFVHPLDIPTSCR